MNNRELNQEELNDQINQARLAAEIADLSEPRARFAYYERHNNQIIVELRLGASFLFPPDLVQGLAGASPEDLMEVEVTPSGEGLHWEKLDVDLSIPSLMLGIFGSPAWMAELTNKSKAS